MGYEAAGLIGIGHGLAAVAYALLAIYLLSQPGRLNDASRKRGRFLQAALWTTFSWAGAVWAATITASRAVVWLAQAADVLRYGAWFAFILVLLRPEDDWRRANRAILAPAAIALALVLAGLLLQLAAALGLAVDDQGPRWLLFHALALSLVGLFLVEQLFRNVAGDSRWNIKPLCLGLAGGFLFDLYLFSDALLFGRLDADAAGIRGVVYLLVMPLVTLSAIRGRDWTKRIRLSRTVVLHTTVLLAAGVYLLFMAGVGYYVRFFGGEWGRALQMALAFAALLGLSVLAFSGAMRARMRVFVGKNFFRLRYDYRSEWLKVTQALATQNSPQAMGEQVIRALADMVESHAGSLWLWDVARQGFRQIARWNMAAAEDLEAQDSPLCLFLKSSGWVINLEEYRSQPGRYQNLELPVWLSALEAAWLIVPLTAGSEMIGFVVLASSRTNVDVNWEVNDLLRTAGSQAAGFLAQMQATEALLEARKFDAFNRMSAFVVHDLKNIISQLSLMLKNAERHKDNPEFQQDMLMTVEHAVDRMRQLMLQLREGATPAGVNCGVDLVEVFRRVQSNKQRTGRTVEVSGGSPLAIRADAQRLERVFGHLVQNALDATENAGSVWVKLGRKDGRASVEVGDSGHGMSAEFVRERLFKPFQTTKQAGMGIGAYESFQYLRELGGDIAVDSEVGVGTTVRISLPLFQESRADSASGGSLADG